MTQKELLKLLSKNNILFVVVGGVAMRLYNSPRVTHDIDLAVRTLDIDDILALLYPHGYFLVTELNETGAEVALSAEDASAWVESSKAGAISLVTLKSAPQQETVPLQEIIIPSQADFLFELGIPIFRLAQNAQTIELDDITFKVACVEDLLTLKQLRQDKTDADRDDIRFLKQLLSQ